jgi:hypothetical protein
MYAYLQNRLVKLAAALFPFLALALQALPPLPPGPSKVRPNLTREPQPRGFWELGKWGRGGSRTMGPCFLCEQMLLDPMVRVSLSVPCGVSDLCWAGGGRGLIKRGSLQQCWLCIRGPWRWLFSSGSWGHVSWWRTN